MRYITEQMLTEYRTHLIGEEKSVATVSKYLHDVRTFSAWLSGRPFEKNDVLAYKERLMACYATASVNVTLSSLNSFFGYFGWYELRVKAVKIQKQVFASSEKELTKAEYERLVQAAGDKKDRRLYMLLQTMCSTGIRVSEQKYITVEAVRCGRAEIECKGKRRTVILPYKLCRMLDAYAKERKIKEGAVFITKNGNPLDRSNIWSDMKRLCRTAHVAEDKVFPHNLRHLFARTYYTKQKDVVRLADILGHENVNTTRIYTMETGEIHRRQIQGLGLLHG